MVLLASSSPESSIPFAAGSAFTSFCMLFLLIFGDSSSTNQAKGFFTLISWQQFFLAGVLFCVVQLLQSRGGMAGGKNALLMPLDSHSLRRVPWNAARLVLLSWLRTYALRNFSLLFAFLLENVEFFLLYPLKEGPLNGKSANGSIMILVGYFLVAGVDAYDYGSLFPTIILVIVALLAHEAKNSIPEAKMRVSLSPHFHFISIFASGLIACVLGLIESMFTTTSSTVQLDPTAITGVIWYPIVLAAVTFGLISVFLSPLATVVSNEGLWTGLMAQTLVGLACGLFSSGYQSMWTRCLLELMACMVILFGQYSQKQALNFGGFSQEAELDTYRTASSLGSGYHRGKGLIPARLAHIFAVLWEKEDSRKILMFLLVNVSYMFIELAVGLWTNSLGLIGDAGHMLFDNGALVIGLVASYIGKLPADHQYTYGYGRVEVLSGFINSLLLLFISFHLMAEAVSRFTDPPEVKTDNLLLTSVIGLLVNLVGLVWFHDHVHAHGHGESCGSGSSHGHSHGDSHGHSHGGHGHNHGHSHASSSSVSSASNSNMYGVYLHVLADTLGSVGVIVSSLLIHFQQWHIADPLSSALISMLIFGSTVPLLKGTCGQLLQRVPEEKEEEFGRAINEILHTVTGVRKVLKWHFWRHTSDICIGSVHLLVDPTVNDQQILYQVQEIFQNCTGVNTKEYFSIQIQRDDTKGLQTLNQSHEHHEHGVPKGCSSAAHSHGHNNHNYHHGHNHVHEHDDQHHHEHEHTCMSTHEDPVEHNWRVQHPSPVPSFQQPFNQPSPPPCSFPSVPQPSNPFCASS